MHIKLTMDIPVSKRHKLTEGTLLEVLREDATLKSRGVWVQGKDEEVKILSHEYVIVEGESTTEHRWEKQNLVTLKRDHDMYDVYKCRNCGITAKRHGFGTVTIDRIYKKDLYGDCTKSRTHRLKTGAL